MFKTRNRMVDKKGVANGEKKVEIRNSCLEGEHASIIESLRLRADTVGLVSAVTRTAILQCPSFGVMTNNICMFSDNYVRTKSRDVMQRNPVSPEPAFHCLPEP